MAKKTRFFYIDFFFKYQAGSFAYPKFRQNCCQIIFNIIIAERQSGGSLVFISELLYALYLYTGKLRSS